MIWDPLVSVARTVLLEPTLGIPVVVTLAALGAWLVGSPAAAGAAPPALRRSWFEPESDLTSQVYFALLDQQYSRVVSAAAGRLDETLRRTRHCSLYELPWSSRGGGIPEARELRRTLRRLTRAHAEALEREGRFFIRWRFWLSRDVDRSMFLRRVDTAVDDAAQWIRTLEART